MNRQCMTLGFVAILLVLGSMAVVLAEENSQSASIFPVDKANLVNIGRNPYFILEPGYRLQFKAEDAALVVTVLDETKKVDGVETRVVEERETESGELIRGVLLALHESGNSGKNSQFREFQRAE